MPEVNPFDSLIQKQPHIQTAGEANPFDSLMPPQPFDQNVGGFTIQTPKIEPPFEPSVTAYDLPDIDKRITTYTGETNRDKAADIYILSAMTGGKLSPSIVAEHYDEVTKELGLRGMPSPEEFLPQLAIAAGMSIFGPGGIAVKGGVAAVRANAFKETLKLILGVGAFEFEEQTNRLVRSKMQGTPFAETKPFSLRELADPGSAMATLLSTLDYAVKGKAIHLGKVGMERGWEALTKQKLEETGQPSRIYVDPNRVEAMLRGYDSEDVKAIWASMGATPEDIESARQHGHQLELPAWKLISVVDKPFWAKIKRFFNVTPYQGDFTAETVGRHRMIPIGGLLPEPGEEPLRPTPPPDQVSRVANAIRTMESGGHVDPYNATSPDGGRGAYQFTGTWDEWSAKYNLEKNGKDAPLEFTPANQDEVAKWKIAGWLSEGKSPQQIFSLWNSGKPEWEGNKGINKAGIPYDVPAYVEKASKLYGKDSDIPAVPVPEPGPTVSSPFLRARGPLTSESLLDGIIKGDVRLQVGWHGSPYEWEKPDLSKVGTGEGAAAYGHGLYVSDSERVGKYYRETTSRSKYAQYYFEGKNISTFVPEGKAEYDVLTPRDKAAIIVGMVRDAQRPGTDITQKSKEFIRNDIKFIKREGTAPGSAERKEPLLKHLAQALKEVDTIDPASLKRTNAGHLYKLDIPSHDKLLDWDKPLSEQPEGVKRALEESKPIKGMQDPGALWAQWPDREELFYTSKELEKISQQELESAEKTLSQTNANLVPYKDIYNRMSGEDLYQTLSNTSGSQQSASEYLRSIGIPGHRYLDQMSRGKGEGTYNYVIYDTEAVKVLTRNDMPVAPEKIDFKGLGYDSMESFMQDYEKRSLQAEGETPDEFAKRIYCLEKLAGRNNYTIRRLK